MLIDQLLVQKVMTHLVSDSCTSSKSADNAMTLVVKLRSDIHLLTSWWMSLNQDRAREFGTVMQQAAGSLPP